MRKTDLAYIAGIFDGEGCIVIARDKGRYYHLVVDLSMANEYIPNLLRFNFGGSVHRVVKPNRQIQWHWRLPSLKAKLFLEVILPYLRLKRNEAELGITFQKGFYFKGSARISDEELVVRQAQKILMSKLKTKQ